MHGEVSLLCKKFLDTRRSFFTLQNGYLTGTLHINTLQILHFLICRLCSKILDPRKSFFTMQNFFGSKEKCLYSAKWISHRYFTYEYFANFTFPYLQVVQQNFWMQGEVSLLCKKFLDARRNFFTMQNGIFTMNQVSITM